MTDLSFLEITIMVGIKKERLLYWWYKSLFTEKKWNEQKEVSFTAAFAAESVVVVAAKQQLLLLQVICRLAADESAVYDSNQLSTLSEQFFIALSITIRLYSHQGYIFYYVPLI